MKNLRTVILLMMYFSIPCSIISAQEPTLSAKSDEVICKNDSQLEIKKFDDKKSKQIVLGRPIKYKAVPNNGSDWVWEIGKGDIESFERKWVMESLEGAIKGKGSNGVIPATTDNMPTENNEFGSTNGKVKVNKIGEEDNLPYSAIDDIKIYYEKDAMNVHDPGVPNWYYYWEQELPENITVLPIYNIDDETMPILNTATTYIRRYSNEGDYKWTPCKGQKQGNTTIDINRVPIDVFNPNGHTYGQSYDIVMTFGEGTSKLCGDKICNISAMNDTTLTVIGGTESTGISCFTQVFNHESEHLKIFAENWPNGYRSDWDFDGDGYSDIFEMENSVEFGFDYMKKEPYRLGAGTPGYDYEEARCAVIEANADPTMLIDVDWSFDPSQVYQGKKW